MKAVVVAFDHGAAPDPVVGHIQPAVSGGGQQSLEEVHRVFFYDTPDNLPVG